MLHAFSWSPRILCSNAYLREICNRYTAVDCMLVTNKPLRGRHMTCGTDVNHSHNHKSYIKHISYLNISKHGCDMKFRNQWFTFTQIHFVLPVPAKWPMDMQHVKIRIIYTALYNTRNTTLYQNSLTLRWLMSYIYGAPILDVSRSHTTTQHSR